VALWLFSGQAVILGSIMARNTQVKHQSRHTGRQYSSQTVPREPGAASGLSQKEVKLTLKQIILFWSVTLVMMLVVFVTGFKAGKLEGANQVLDQIDQQMVRLPVIRPHDIKSDELNKSGMDAETASEARSQGASGAQGEMDEGSKIDFTKEATLPLKESGKVDSPQAGSVQTAGRTKREEVYEEIYPGKNLFLPPAQKSMEADKTDVTQPVLPGIGSPAGNDIQDGSADMFLNDYAPVPGWYVQVAAAPSEDDAQNYLQRIMAKGLDVRIEEASIRDKIYYRILVGPYSDRKDALGNRGKIKAASGVSGEPFIRQVK
jgi:hypothetical protein